MKKTTLTISGMHCSSCAGLIDIDVEEIAGVSSVDTDYRKGIITLTYDGQKHTLESVRKTIINLGYSVGNN